MLDAWTLLQYIEVGLIGLIAGTLGGMLGVGGSVIMIPFLTFTLGPAQHLYQASAMAANVVISVPAALRHRRAGVMVPAVLRWMMPAALVFVVVGVALSNLKVFAGSDGGRWLGRLLAVLLAYVVVVNVLRFRREWAAAARDARNAQKPDTNPQRTTQQNSGSSAHDAPTAVTPPRSFTVGTVMGTIAGLLGVGGGAIAVPLQQTVLHLPLRNAIANSAAVICLSSAVGAVVKLATLAQHGTTDAPLSWKTGLALALLLAPTAWVGGRLGAALTHALPIRYVRLAFIVLMAVAAVRMAW